MQWYWWLLIAVAALVIGYYKLKILKAILKKQKQAQGREEEE